MKCFFLTKHLRYVASFMRRKHDLSLILASVKYKSGIKKH